MGQRKLTIISIITIALLAIALAYLTSAEISLSAKWSAAATTATTAMHI